MLQPSRLRSLATFRSWYWLLVPLAAVLAYLTVLRIGFLSDDFLLLTDARQHGIDPGAFIPQPSWSNYRPVGVMLTWQLGWSLWGFNPLPFHAVGLALHALTSLVLGLWLASATGRPVLGWLAGLLFAVFPLHLEAVGWLAAQWDLWAALFGLLSLWLFTRWWRSRTSAATYLLSILCFGLALFSKESVLAFLPVFFLSAWLVTPRLTWRAVRTLVLYLIPFGLLLALNVAIRLATWGSLSVYSDAPTDYGNFFFDNLATFVRLLLSPVNATVLGTTTAQVVAAVSTLCVLSGLLLYGRYQFRLVCVAATWILLTLVPVLNIPPRVLDLQQNRFLYLPSAGYCTLLAALLYAAAKLVRRTRLRALLVGATGAIALLGAVVCWVQLEPWHTGTVQAQFITQQLNSLIPARSQDTRPMTWFVERLPDNYKGAYLFRLGLGAAVSFTGGDGAIVQQVGNAEQVDLTSEEPDAFAFRFRFNGLATRYEIGYIAGITGPDSTLPEEGSDPVIRTWDFRDCNAQAVRSWQAENAQISCVPGTGLVVVPGNQDPQLLVPLTLGPMTAGSGFLRLRVSVRYPPSKAELPASSSRPLGEWFWKGPGYEYGGTHHSAFALRADGRTAVYWTFIPADTVGEPIDSLRFDPINAQTSAEIRWIDVAAVGK